MQKHAYELEIRPNRHSVKILYEDSWVFVVYFPTREYRILIIQYRSG